LYLIGKTKLVFIIVQKLNILNTLIYLTFIFSVDKNRIEKIGPDQACAEWLLRNGAFIKWMGTEDYLNDYNSLPKERTNLHLQRVDATNSAIHHVGFPYFCKFHFIIKYFKYIILRKEVLFENIFKLAVNI
jgi:hypothetical protein